MSNSVVITGVGLVSPLGRQPDVVLDRLRHGDTAAGSPAFATDPYDCSICAAVEGFDGQDYFPDNKSLRFMNRDARMAVVAARMAMQDAGVQADSTYPGDQIALFGATGVMGLPMQEVEQLVRLSAAPDGSLDLTRFGGLALKRVRPVLTFKILANIPICFVSIFEGVRGENAVHTPWEGNGAHAILAGVRAIREGRAPCALVGGCDVKTLEFSFITLQQLGVFDSWRTDGRGCIPGEGAGFLVLESETVARSRGARIYARVGDSWFCSDTGEAPGDCLSTLLSGLRLQGSTHVIAAAGGDIRLSDAETYSLAKAGVDIREILYPKAGLGNLFAAAAAVQVGLAAELARQEEPGHNVLANCFGHGSEKAVFVLESV